MARTAGAPAPRQSRTEVAPGRVAVSLDGAAVLPLSVEGLDPERLTRLRGVGVRLRQPAVAELVREQAARAQASTPPVTQDSDREAMRVIVHLLADSFYRTGEVDPRRALRRASVDSYLMERKREVRRTVRWQLYSAGRALYPGEYPPALVVSAPRHIPTPPCTDRDVQALYTVARSLSPRWRAALTLLLDLIGGVGARPSELKHLRRGDVWTASLNGQMWTLVRLQTPSSPARVVPVWDRAIATRLERYAHDAPHEHLLALGREPAVERNGVNRINSRLTELGYPERLDAKALRNRWLRQMAEALPIAPFMRIAGVGSMPRAVDIGVDHRSGGDLASIAAILESGRS